MRTPRLPLQTPGLTFFVTAAAALTLALGIPEVAQAQVASYWASDGCQYQHNGSQMIQVECQWYDPRLGTRVARNAQGMFYQLDGQWLTATQYNTLAALRQLAQIAAQESGTILIHPNQNPQGILGSTVSGSSPESSCLANWNQLPPALQAQCKTYMDTQTQIGLWWTQPSPYPYRYR